MNITLKPVLTYCEPRADQELPAVDMKTSNWKGTLISIVVIAALCSAIILAIYVINPDIQSKLTKPRADVRTFNFHPLSKFHLKWQTN